MDFTSGVYYPLTNTLRNKMCTKKVLVLHTSIQQKHSTKSTELYYYITLRKIRISYLLYNAIQIIYASPFGY